jgi:hypothetical protein
VRVRNDLSRQIGLRSRRSGRPRRRRRAVGGHVRLHLCNFGSRVRYRSEVERGDLSRDMGHGVCRAPTR